MYYVKVGLIAEEDCSYWDNERGGYTSVRLPTTRLVGPFKYRKDVEDYMSTNEVLEVIQID